MSTCHRSFADSISISRRKDDRLFARTVSHSVCLIWRCHCSVASRCWPTHPSRRQRAGGCPPVVLVPQRAPGKSAPAWPAESSDLPHRPVPRCPAAHTTPDWRLPLGRPRCCRRAPPASPVSRPGVPEPPPPTLSRRQPSRSSYLAGPNTRVAVSTLAQHGVSWGRLQHALVAFRRDLAECDRLTRHPSVSLDLTAVRIPPVSGNSPAQRFSLAQGIAFSREDHWRGSPPKFKTES